MAITFGTHLSQHGSHRSGVERLVIPLLDQIFEQMGLVGSVCLAGPDPQKGGKLMTMSWVPWLPFIAHTRSYSYICLGFTNHSQMVKLFRTCMLATKEASPIQCACMPHSSSVRKFSSCLCESSTHSLHDY
jgi:hypothetical protein